MADANVLKNAQNVEPARNKFRETEGTSGIVTKLAIVGVIVQAFVSAKNILFGEKATANVVASSSATETNGEAATTANQFDAEQIVDERNEATATEGEGSSHITPKPFGSGTTFSRQFGSPDVAVPQNSDHISGDHRAVKAGINDNAPVIAFPISLTSNPRPFIDAPTAILAAGTGQSGLPSSREREATDSTNVRSNRAPEVKSPHRLGITLTGQAVVIAAADLLRHASDADADPLSIGAVVSGPGATLRQVEGNWILTPTEDFNGLVDIAFSVTDGRLFSVGRSVIEVLDFAPSVLIGATSSEAIVGTPQPDTIYGEGGDDDVIGREGADVIQGGEGRDRIAGGDGDDVIRGGGGNDILLGQGGDDVIFAGGGDDVVEGGDGDDALFGEEGADVILGQSGNDVLDGGAGADLLSGGDGDDTVVAQSNDGDDKVEGRDGQDTLDFSATSAPVIVDLAAGRSLSSEAGSDAVSGIENVVGSAGADIIVGDGADNVVTAGQGNDVIETAAGNDTAIASPRDGDDAIDGGAGIDTYDASRIAANMIVDLEAGMALGVETGTDKVVNVENVIAGNGSDTITANDLVNVLFGGDGDDVFVFRTSASAGSGHGYRDVILDFEPGDRIDLRDISREFDREFGELMDDARLNKFTIIASGEEFARPGQIRFAHEQLDGKTMTIVQGNTDADTMPEFEIELAGHIEMQEHHLYKSPNLVNGHF